MEATAEHYWIGFDLGGTKMLITLFDEQMVKMHQLKLTTKPYGGVKESVARVVSAVEQLFTESGGPRKSLAGIGIGVPGVVNMDAGEVIDAPNLGWHAVEIGSLLESTFGVPVAVINDVDAGLFGEYRMGAAKDAHCVLGIFPGTGIGSGCIYEGKILKGICTTAMEIGHIQVVDNGFRCGCGKYGCLETVASRLAIAGQAAIAAYRGEAPALMASAGCNIAKIKSGTLTEAIAKGDTVIDDIVRRAAFWLGKGIAVAINLLAPDVVLLGGGLVEAMPELFIKEVPAAIDPELFKVYRNTFRIVVSQLGDDAVSLGAAHYVKASVRSS